MNENEMPSTGALSEIIHNDKIVVVSAMVSSSSFTLVAFIGASGGSQQKERTTG